MRIEKRRNRPTVSRSVVAPDSVLRRRVTETPKESFEQLLQSEEHTNLQSMLEEVVRLGDNLLEKRTLQDLEQYKAAVKRFVQYAVNRAFRVRKASRLSGGWSRLVETMHCTADLTEVVLTRRPLESSCCLSWNDQGLLVDCLR